MKVLLNATTARTGGALQIATSFIRQATKDDLGVEWAFALSKAVAQELEQFGIEVPGVSLVFDEPSRNLAARRQLCQFEKVIAPACCFTLSGPAYVRFRGYHVLGCANGFVTHPSWTAYRGYSLRQGVDALLRNWYRARWFRHADAWIVQTQRARDGFAQRLNCANDAIVAISNTCDDIYATQARCGPFPRATERVKLLCFSASHAHKNLLILPRIAQCLRQMLPALDFRIVVTLPEDDWLLKNLRALFKRFNVADCLENRGPTPVVQGPELYKSCHILLLPTLLETFTTTYPEAMAMGLPIVTSDLDFAHEQCGPAAFYHPPFDPRRAAQCIARLLHDPALWEAQVRHGHDVLRRIPSQRERYQQTVNAILCMAASRSASRRFYRREAPDRPGHFAEPSRSKI